MSAAADCMTTYRATNVDVLTKSRVLGWLKYMLIDLDFSYDSYRLLLQTLLAHDYSSRLIGETIENEKVLYLRHDVDVDYLGVLPMAEIEHSLGMRSTWYFLSDCPIYNLCSRELRDIIYQLHEQGHQIGLHIDATNYVDLEEMMDAINVLYSFFSSFLPISKTLSFHRPAPWLLDDVIIPGWINAYQKEFFADVVYVSDSNRREFWKEERLSAALKDDKPLTLLTHPLWWKRHSLQPDTLFQASCRMLGSDRTAVHLSETSKIYSDTMTAKEGIEHVDQ